MVNQYVIKTRDGYYLCYNSITEKFTLGANLQYVDKYDTIEEARKYSNANCLVDSKYKADIIQLVLTEKFIERVV